MANLIATVTNVIFLVFVTNFALASDVHLDTMEVGNVEVIDGNTIKLPTGELVRYIGIDAPQKNEPFAEEATDYNRSLVEEKKLLLEFDVQKYDDNGNLLAYVYVGDEFVNRQILRRGYARAIPVHPNVKHEVLFEEGELYARRKTLGLWELGPALQREYYRDALTPNTLLAGMALAFLILLLSQKEKTSTLDSMLLTFYALVLFIFNILHLSVLARVGSPTANKSLMGSIFSELISVDLFMRLGIIVLIAGIFMYIWEIHEKRIWRFLPLAIIVFVYAMFLIVVDYIAHFKWLFLR